MPRTRQAARLEDEQRKRRKLGDNFDVVLDDAISTVIQHCTDAALNDGDKIARSVKGIDRLKSACATLLLERAKTLGGKRKYLEAIADATKAIEYRPESADGYITASYLYTTREQHQEAIKILESGLRALPPAERPLLDGYLRAAKELVKQKIDFVPKLPTELTINIFTELDNDASLVECALVSRSWREFLLHQCPSLWRNARMGYNRLNPTARLLPSVSEHVQMLEVFGQDADYGPLFEKLIDILTNKGLPQLYDIYIEIPSYDQVVRYSMRIVTPIRHQLTRVLFLATDDEPDISFPLDLILASCPNLDTLELLFGDNNNIAYQPSQSTPDNYRLKKLLLTAGNTESIFEQLIPRCPELERIETYKCGPRNLALIDQHCPRFRELLAGQELLIYPLPPKDDSHLGLYDVQYDMHNTDEMQQLIPMVVRSKSTLITLVLTIEGPANPGALNQLAYHTFSRLENFGIFVEDDVQGFENIAAKILPQCPMLKDVALNVDIEMPDRVFGYLTMLPHLKKLYLYGIQAPSTTFQQLFAHYSARGDKSTLENIRIRNCNEITDDVLEALSSIKTLQEITMDGTTEDVDVTPDGILMFTRNILALPNLKHTDLSGVPYIPKDAARKLARINILNRKW